MQYASGGGKFFSGEWFDRPIITGELSGGDLTGALRQGVLD